MACLPCHYQGQSCYNVNIRQNKSNYLGEACKQVHGRRSSLRARCAIGLALIFCRRTWGEVIGHLPPQSHLGILPQTLATRTAISREMLVLPFTRLFSAWHVTPGPFTPSITFSPNGSRQSCHT